MKTVTFQFAETIGRAEQDQLLNQIRHWQGVEAVDRIDPESPVPFIERMCFASICDDEPIASSVSSGLQQLPQVASVETPVQRQLIF